MAFSRTSWVSQHQKGKSFLILMKQETTRWQWHQMDHMQTICIWLQTDNHASTITYFFTDWMLFLTPNQQCQSTQSISGASKMQKNNFQWPELCLSP